MTQSTPLKKYSIPFLIFLFFSCEEATKKPEEMNEKQNFVFILVDDLGWTD